MDRLRQRSRTPDPRSASNIVASRRHTGCVNAATHRTDVEYVWPQTLIRPSRNVRLVYLDQAQWIYLAQAATGHADGGKHVASLEALRSFKAGGSILWRPGRACQIRVLRADHEA